MKNAIKINFTLYPEYIGTEKMVSIHNDRRAIRIANHYNFQIFQKSGSWNGYGYETLDRFVTSSNAKIIRKELKKIDKRNEKRKPSKIYSPDEKIDRWAKRLNKLTNCGIKTAKEIATEKIDYAFDNLQRQLDWKPNGWNYPAWYRTAEKKMDKANQDQSTLLQFIKDEEHAYAILAASRRHNESDYEVKLEEGKELKALGEIEDTQEYARNSYQYNQ